MSMLFKTHLVTDQELEDCQDTFNSLIKQTYLPGCKPEKLYTPDETVVFSIRTTRKRRVIFTYFKHAGEMHPLILGIADQHNYSDFMKKSLYADYLKKHEEEFKHIIDEFNEQQTSQSNNNHVEKIEQKQVHIIGKQAIVLNENQLDIQAPAIVEGPPGSGKTCVAFAQLEKFVQEKEKGKKILYVTQSKKLADHVKALWVQSPLYDENNPDDVTICSYDELLENFYSGLKFEGQAQTAIIEWLLGTTGIISSKLKNKDRQARAEKMYQEFRIISGYSNAEDYLKAGDKKTLFGKDQRPDILKAYLLFREQHKNIHYPEFYPIVLSDSDERKFDKILVDEGQDFSHLQLKNIMSLAKHKRNLIYFSDPKQSLNDDISKILFLQELFYDNGNGISVEPTKLNVCYRCPPRIMELAKKVNDLRLRLTPRGKQEAPIQVNQDLEGGNIAWLDTSKAESLKTIEDMKHDSDVCIITDEANQKRLMDSPYHFSRVFTPKDIKGLQYKTVILFEPLSQEIFYQINSELESETNSGKEDNVQFSSPLCSLFTSITRAENQIIFYQTENARLKNLIHSFKPSASQEAVTNKNNAPLDLKQKLSEARELFQNGNILQAQAVLKNEVYSGSVDADRLSQETINDWSVPASSSSSSTTKNKVDLFDALINNNPEIIKREIQRFSDAKISKKEGPDIIKKIIACGDNQIKYRLLAIASKYNISGMISLLLSVENRHHFNWNFVFPSDNKTVLKRICENEIRTRINDVKMMQTNHSSLTNEHVSILINDIKVNLNLLPTKKSEQPILFDLLTSSVYDVARLFLQSEQINLEFIFKNLNKDDLRAVNVRMIYSYLFDNFLSNNINVNPVNLHVLNFLATHNPNQLYTATELIYKKFGLIAFVTESFTLMAERGHPQANDMLAKNAVELMAKARESGLLYQESIYASSAIDFAEKGTEETKKVCIPFLQSRLAEIEKEFTKQVNNEVRETTALMLICLNRPDDYLNQAKKLICTDQINLDTLDKKGYCAFVYACLRPNRTLAELFFSRPDFDLDKTYESVPNQTKQLFLDRLANPELLTLVKEKSPQFAQKYALDENPLKPAPTVESPAFDGTF